ncbi:unnamed protein product [Aphis gossypii]|uniref:RNA-directed DNA polymerase n=1 Tax=Aphis gossypii TaxID=80765 RepID=A0A9P0NES6_APHGO|nr:unnamed protein product [Aphis gossypii]
MHPETSKLQIKRITYSKRNETSIITANELTRDEEYEIQPDTEKNGCPYISIRIHDTQYEMLVDSGAEISAISTEYENTILESDKSIPTLPLTGMVIHSATGDKSTRVNRQLLIPLSINNKIIRTPFITVPALNEGGIIGNDFLETHNARIDFGKRTMSITVEQEEIKIPFVNKHNGAPMHLKTIQTQVSKEPIYPRGISTHSHSEQNYLDRILKKFSNVFRDEPGKIKNYECKIKLKNNTPICVKPYPIPVSKQEAVNKEVEKMLKMGIIERSRSPYSIPVVPVFKKNGEVRLCLDARKINEQIVMDCERPLTIESILTKFKNVKYISTLDLRSGYWQVPLADESKAPCSFLINGRNFSYTRLPFGLCISGAEFQKAMDKVLGDLTQEFVTIYVDDILITSPSLEEHYDHIQRVLTKFMEHNVTINLEKCQFFRNEVTFLGHVIFNKGIKMDDKKIKTIQDFKAPSNKKELQSFLGFLNFYRRFINKFAHTIEPLIELVKKDKKWCWHESHQTAFEEAKAVFLQEVTIAFPDFSHPFHLNTDASTAAIGGELFQIINGHRHTLGYASRTLKPAETRYTTTEQEALAIVYCCAKFRQYIIGHNTIVQTDHHALTFMRKCRLTSGRLTRWSLALQEYDLTIEYIPGKLNVAADTLTRYPRVNDIRKEKKISINAIKEMKYSKELSDKLKMIGDLQKTDQYTSRLRKKPSIFTTTKDGITFSRTKLTEQWRVIIPEQIRDQIIRETHRTMGHPGRFKTYHVLNNICTFRNMNRSIANVIKTCDECQKNKPLNFKTAGNIMAHKPTKLLEKISVDLMGPLPTGRGGVHYILAILDTFSKYIKLYALKRATTKAILNKIESEYISEIGKPESILTDNGTQFANKKWRERMNELGISVSFSTIYHPQSNPVERYNREIGRILRTYCNEQHTKWPNMLGMVEEWMNKMKSEITEETPFETMFKKKPNYQIHKIISFPDQPDTDENIICLVADRIRTKAEKREKKKMSSKRKKYEVGQHILIRNHQLSNAEHGEIKKLFNLFNGPYEITKIISQNTLVIRNPITKKEQLTNIAEVRPYYQMNSHQ